MEYLESCTIFSRLQKKFPSSTLFSTYLVRGEKRKMIQDQGTSQFHSLVLLHPLLQNSRNLQTVLLHEYHMSIPMDANIRQLEVLGRHTCLL